MVRVWPGVAVMLAHVVNVVVVVVVAVEQEIGGGAGAGGRAMTVRKVVVLVEMAVVGITSDMIDLSILWLHTALLVLFWWTGQVCC